MDAINRGIVMKGPMPTMLDIFRAVAGSKPKARVRWGCVSAFTGIGGKSRESFL
jgi:hypothetical protein